MSDLVDDVRIGVIGLGYVGLPLAVEFGKRYDTRGYDVNAERVAALARGEDRTREVSADELAAATRCACRTRWNRCATATCSS
jgi:UDP-N-acetyl-D-galactosamine dehydrogenase